MTVDPDDAMRADVAAAVMELIRANPALLLLVDPTDGRVVAASDAAAAFVGASPAALIGRTLDDLAVARQDTIQGYIDEAMRPGGERTFCCEMRVASGIRVVETHCGPVEGAGRRLLQVALHDVTEHRATELERGLLGAAIDQVADAVVLTDAQASIIYTNPAFQRVSGYAAEELLGQNPNIVKSGLQSEATYESMWASLLAGATWRGELVNRRKDGSLYTEEATITPIRDAAGSTTHFVGVKRDITVARAMQAQLDGANGEYMALSGLLADLAPGGTVTDTARAICDRVLALPGMRFAALVLFIGASDLRTLAVMGPDRRELPAVIPSEASSAGLRRRAHDLRARARSGWSIERWDGRAVSAMAEVFAELDITALGLAPMIADGEVVGFLQAGAFGGDGEEHVRSARTVVQALARIASLFIGGQAAAVDARARQDDTVRRTIEERAFIPVFQPIVRLDDQAVVGFEALTRFADHAPPELRFKEAADLGLGIELEFATLEAAVADAAMLPRRTWLDLNVSPALLERTEPLAALLWRLRPDALVLEITEHEAIRDYAQVRERVAALGLPAKLAVDDAGAGYASLRHILELRPQLIKLDRTLIAGLDNDPIRQGLVAGLRHFATAAGAELLAEGIETSAELAAVRSLGVTYGQGYLLGRPAPALELLRNGIARRCPSWDTPRRPLVPPLPPKPTGARPATA